MLRTLPLLAAAAALAVLPALPLTAQAPASARGSIDSGVHTNAGGHETVVAWSRTVRAGDAAAHWMQVHFDAETSLPAGASLRLESALDGGIQTLDDGSLRTWHLRSALFNGAAVTVELVLAPGTGPARVVVAGAEHGGEVVGTASLCGPDDRVRATDGRIGRLDSGSTGFMVLDDVLLTTGTGAARGSGVVEFRVPASTASGRIVRADPSDQYPFTVLDSGSAGAGVDWAVCRLAPNSNTGQLPPQRNGVRPFSLGNVPGSVSNQSVVVEAYGTAVGTGVPASWNFTLTGDTGPLVALGATTLGYAVDAPLGAEGAPLRDATDPDTVVGMHTVGECATANRNTGVRIDEPALRNAISAAAGAAFERFGRGCPMPPTFYEDFNGQFDLRGQSLLFQAGAGGGWRVQTCVGSNCFETGFSNNLRLGDDQLARGLALGFSFPLPGVGATTRIDVDSNGWVGLVSGQHGGSDYTPSVNEFLADPARLAACWRDLNPSAGGAVFFDVFPGRAVVTWDRVPEFGQPGSSNTVQVQFFANGDVIVSWGASNTATTLLFGYSNGSVSPDPGPLDVSAALPFSTGSGGSPIGLSPTMLPVIGGSAGIRLDAMPINTTAATLLVGIGRQNVDLTPFGAWGCSLLVLPVGTVAMQIGATTAFVQLPIPNQRALIGFRFPVQAVVLAPGVTGAGAATSEGAELRVGV